MAKKFTNSKTSLFAQNIRKEVFLMKENKRKKAVVLTVSYLSAAVIALGILAGTNYQRAETYKRYVAANYQHAFGELVTAVSEMDTALQKSLYATSPSMVSAVCTEVFGKAMTAQMSLGVLPFSTQELEQTAGFISRVGDYAFALSRSAGSGAGYTDEEKKNLKALSETANLLSANMKSLQTDLMDGVLTIDGEVAYRLFCSAVSISDTAVTSSPKACW